MELSIDLVTRSYQNTFGLARYTASLVDALVSQKVDLRVLQPSLSPSLSKPLGVSKRLGYDVSRFFETYPMTVEFRKHAIKHLTVQSFATLLMFRQAKNTIVTVHDLIPFLMRHDKEYSQYKHRVEACVDAISVQQLNKATRLIAVSEHVKSSIVQTLGYPPERIDVVLEGVDHSLFRPRHVCPDFLQMYGLDPNSRIILYVGSEAPKKNLAALVRAVSKIKDSYPDILLVKVGSVEYGEHARKLQALIDDSGLSGNFRSFTHPPQEDLAQFYTAAEIFVYPSMFEGFGLPPLEAMASGTPVIASNATSIPEVVGDAGVLFNPSDSDELAQCMISLLSNRTLQMELRSRGLARASGFTWAKTAEETIQVYEKVALCNG